VNCTDEAVGGLLADYYAGQLPVEQWLAVEAHVEECDACRKSLALMMTLGGGLAPDPYRSGHVTPERLARYYHSEGSIPDRDADAIARHLDTCERCGGEYRFLTGLAAELSTAGAIDPMRSSPGPSWQAVRQFFARPIVAWAVVVLLAYPALSWMVARVRPTGRRSYTEAVGPAYRLRESRRGAENLLNITRTADQPLLQLVVPMYALPDEMDYRFEFSSASGEPVRPQAIASFATAGEIDLLVDASMFDDGIYTLTVVETQKGAPAPHASKTYSFKLVTQP
jgi:hypothetical protein